MKMKLDDVCTKESSTYVQKDLECLTGKYPIFGASGFIKNIDKYKQKKEYVAVIKDGAGVGRSMLLPAESSVIGTLQYLIPKKNIEVKYLYYLIKSMHLEKHSTGATIPHIYFKDYKNNEFNLPDRSIQKKIISVFEKTETIIESKKKQIQLLNDLIKSRFVEMFGAVHNSNKYSYKPVGELTKVISGGTPNRKCEEYWLSGNIPWIKTTELKNKVIESSEEYITVKGLTNSSARVVPPNTVLIAMYGQGKTRGMTGYLNIKAATNQACACILPSDKIDSIFIWKYFELSYDKLRNLAKGGNQPNLNGNMIKKFPVVCPPMIKQRQFADFVKQVDKSKFAIQQSLDETQKLYDALMQKYFG